MEVNEIFKDFKDFINYLKDNNINSLNELTFSDVLIGAQGKEGHSKIIAKYLEYRRGLNNVDISEDKIDKVFLENNNKEDRKINKLKDIKSKWLNVDEIVDGISIRSFLEHLITYLSYNKYKDKDFIQYLKENNIYLTRRLKSKLKEFDIDTNFNKLICFNNIIKCKNINKNKITYNEYKRLISIYNKDLYINSLVSKKVYKEFVSNEIYKIEDIYYKINEKLYNKYYLALIKFFPLLYETNRKYIPCDFIIEDLIKKANLFEDLTITMMKIKGLKDNDICMGKDIKYKDILKSFYKILDFLIRFFDSYYGNLFITYLLSINKGYISKVGLMQKLPKYYSLIDKLISKELIYKVYYNENYEIYTNKKIEKEDVIFNRYQHNIEENKYNELISDINKNLLNHNICLDIEKIKERIAKVYTKCDNIYTKGYISNEYKVFKIYEDLYYNGIENDKLNNFEDKFRLKFNEDIDIVNKKYNFFKKVNNKYYLKKKIIDKFNISNDNKIKDYEINYYIIIRVCESQKSIFDCKDVLNEINKGLNINTNIKVIKKFLIKCDLYYQISYNKFIKSDDLYIDNDLMRLFIKYKDLSSKELFEIINLNNKGFLKKYSIKNKDYLKRIVKKIVSKKVKILAINDKN